MIYFITNRTHEVSHPNICVTKDFGLVHNYLNSVDSFAFDEEFNGLNAILATPLLTQVGDENVQFVIDNIAFPNQSWLTPYRKKEMIGHNIKIDLSVATVNGFELHPTQMKIWDTMVCEQRLGLDSHRLNNLHDVAARRLNIELPKDDRERFTYLDKNATFITNDILYAAKDVEVLPQIKKIQEQYVANWNITFLMKEIEFPLIPILAKAELEGININTKKWFEIMEDNKKLLFEKELELDDELRKIGFSFPIRRKEEVIQIGLFGENSSSTNLAKKHINYSSSTQIKTVFSKVGEKVPVESKKSVDKDTKNKSYDDKETLGEGAILTYIIENPKSKLIPFLNKLIEYKEVAKELSSYADKYLKPTVKNKSGKVNLGYYRTQTGKVHTIYRQCFTKTGRLASGEAKWGYFNSQNIPAIKKYRTAFTLSDWEIANDWWLTTADLSGAETVIMCAFAKDPQLYKWAIEEDDLHSPMGTLCWQAVYRYRKSKIDNSWATGSVAQVDKSAYNVKDSKGKIHILTADFKLSKADDSPHKQMRTDFKAVTFGVVYGAESSTIAKVLNISKTEAQIIINTIKNAIPDTFAMVLKAADEAINTQRLVHNTRTNSIKHFTQTWKGVSNMSSDEISSVRSEARNSRIQGTQADMVKEAMVAVYRKFEELNIPHCPIFQVHDELVWKHKGKDNGKWIPLIMGEVATKYLEGFTEMKADSKTKHTWTK